MTGRAWRPSSGRGLAGVSVVRRRAEGVARDELVDAGRQRVRDASAVRRGGLMTMV
ncbi:hypothetical protein [Streptomyces cavernae]|uniref:hypothetical protein n=1 Tax=Streptomyces cavernae TaxID=2259034 RepID=UPI0012D87392|nr:hypothetical protein [Streptomyces cavernae]